MAGASGATAAFVFDAPALFTETGFFAGADFFAAFAEAAFFAGFHTFAQRALWAAAILSRASALNVRVALALPAKLVLAGRPGFRISVVLYRIPC